MVVATICAQAQKPKTKGPETPFPRLINPHPSLELRVRMASKNRLGYGYHIYFFRKMLTKQICDLGTHFDRLS